jgi:ABC-2 type transport system ATP-binding protein
MAPPGLLIGDLHRISGVSARSGCRQRASAWCGHDYQRNPGDRVVGLRKSYGDLRVLDGVDLQVAVGTVFALLGPNGAGKTTTVHILSTLIEADGGTVRILGHDVVRQADSVRKVIGVTGQFSAVDNLLTGEENLLLMADLNHLDRAKGCRRVDELLERFDLVDGGSWSARR